MKKAGNKQNFQATLLIFPQIALGEISNRFKTMLKLCGHSKSMPFDVIHNKNIGFSNIIRSQMNIAFKYLKLLVI